MSTPTRGIKLSSHTVLGGKLSSNLIEKKKKILNIVLYIYTKLVTENSQGVHIASAYLVYQ